MIYQGSAGQVFGLTGDVFEGVVPGGIPFAAARGSQPELHQGLSLELGSPWSFYRQFWRAHNIEHLAGLHSPEIGLKDGQPSPCSVALLMRNDTDQPREINVTVVLPAGWKELRGTARYPVRAHSVYPVRAEFVAQPISSPEWKVITWNADVDGKRAGSISLRVFAAPSGSFFRPAGEPGTDWANRNK